MSNAIKRNLKIYGPALLLTAVFVIILSNAALAQNEFPDVRLPDINIGTDEPEQNSMSTLLYLLAGFTLLSLAPYLIIMGTAFIRVTIVLSFIRTALGTQQVPPTQVLMGLGIFITFYVMAPTGQKIHEEAIMPYMRQEIKIDEMVKKAQVPLREFLLKQTRDKDLILFIKLSRQDPADFETRGDVPLHVLMPAFVLSEIKTAFEIGFVIYLPFLVIDMVVASVLMSMGMFMLSPMQISMPFKLLLFVMIDGWGLIIENLVKSFKM